MQDSSPLEPEDCAHLVQKAKQGDLEAYNQLYLFHSIPIWKFLTRLVGNAEDARDLMQDAFVQGWRKRASLQDDYRFQPWMYTIAFNIAKTFLRRRQPRRWVSWEEHEKALLTAEEREAISKLENDVAESEFLNLALDHVTPTYRACLLLSLEEFPHKEIAEMLGIPTHNVSKNISRGKEQLRQAYRYLQDELQSSLRKEGV